MTLRNRLLILCSAALASALPVLSQPAFVAVISRPVSRTVDLPGEFEPYLSVSLHARVPGYVERVLVDRGSAVKEGQALIELSAPEMTARIAEAAAKAQSAESDRAQAEARLTGARSTYDRLRKASQTPGAIAGNELVQAEQEVQAAEALSRSRAQAVTAAQASQRALEELETYLRITVPFDGVVTERLVHPGALVGPGSDTALLTVQQISRLRLVVSVPEEYSGDISAGAKVTFHVSAFPGKAFTGAVARSAHALDRSSRTLPVELDVANSDGALAPGMYPRVSWPVRSSGAALLVPKTAVVTTTERTFVIRDRNGAAEWVDVAKGAADGDLIEIRGDLHPGDKVVSRATDEIRNGARLQAAGK